MDPPLKSLHDNHAPTKNYLAPMVVHVRILSMTSGKYERSLIDRNPD